MLIQCVDVGHAFGDSLLFRGLHTTLVPGEVTALVGPSGSGKSTLLSILAGWLKPSYGSVTLTDVEKVAWVFQNPFGATNRTVLDHVVLPMLTTGVERTDAEEHAASLLETVGLERQAHQPFGSLSGGEAQRLMLARGLAARPDLLLLDEPTAQLDQRTADDVNAAIAAIAGRNTIVVVATHSARTRAVCTNSIDLETC